MLRAIAERLLRFAPLLRIALQGAVLMLFPLAAAGQTLTITNGIQTYAALTNTTVTMTGRCELWVTNSTAPISGCTINLNSPDSWLFLPNILPSVAVSTYLSQITVNGSAAVVDSNVRVVQYAMGAVVIPYPSSLQPLQIFAGPNFSGASKLLGPYTYYNSTAALGAMYTKITSFKLKRGYMATFAQAANGTGISKCYVAQDNDLEVGTLPPTLANNVRFVVVFPWRWTSKKGISGNPGLSLLNLRWWYDWNIDQNSSRDLEYVAIRQNQSWPGLSQNWQTRGINTVLGYNEPDQAAQANMSVATAIGSWPDLLTTGLRVGSPAVSDGGRSSWLYPFMTQADAAGLRVDFVAVHYYQCHDPSDPNGAASQMYNFLLDIYNHTHRPIWITEWNNGANWTTCADPTYAQQQACISAMIAMLDSTPFVERYALYNWVEDVRSLVDSNGVITAAGVTYRDDNSPKSYIQGFISPGTRGIAQYQFETNTLDSSGYGNNGFAFGSPGYTTGHTGQAIALDGTNNFIQLLPNMANSNAFSFAAWVYWNGGANWQRIFDFGNDTTHYMFLTPSSSSGTLRFAIKNGGSEQIVETTGLTAGQWQHVAVTLSGGTASLYTNGFQAASGSVSITPSNFSPAVNYLGKSQFSTDPLFSGYLDEVQIADYAFTPAQIAALLTNSPPQFTTNLISLGTAQPSQVFSSNITGSATDPDPGDTVTYSKANGPSWLTINADGTLSGTPGGGDGGTNYFTARATDSAGASAFTVLTIYVPIIYANGTWILDASGNWGDAANWSGGTNANGAGYTADFSTLNISTDRTVTLDQPRSIGTLTFGDTSGTQNWILDSEGDALTLDTGLASSPSIVVNQNTATIALTLAGVNGFTKTGAGTLVLSASNSLAGTIYIDRNNNTANDGATRVAYPGALGSVTNIQIRNNNDGYSTLQLDGSSSNITVTARLNVSCRNNDVPTIESLGGTNKFSGFVTLDVGGNRFNIVSDAGLLVFANTNRYLGSLTGGRSYVFTGAGDHLVSGPILNATNSAPISLTKSGTGTLRLNAVNAYTNGTTVNGGTLLVNGTIISNATVASSATLGGSGLIKGLVTIANGATLSPGDPSGTLTINGNLVLNNSSMLAYALGVSSDRTAVTGNLTVGGTLNVTDAGGFAAGTYTLFTYTGALTYNGLTVGTLPAGFNATVSTGTAGQVNLVVALAPPGASFTASPLSGVEPLPVRFTDTSTGSPTSWAWDFDNNGATDSAGQNPTNTYAAGTYTVKLIACNGGGCSTNTQVNYINVITVLQSWQNYYGVAPDASDPFGVGMSNTNKLLAGFNPINGAAYPHILSIAISNGTDIAITYLGSNGDTNYPGGPMTHTNVLEFTPGTADGGYTYNFASTGLTNVLSGGIGLGTNVSVTESFGATNSPARYYRVRVLVP